MQFYSAHFGSGRVWVDLVCCLVETIRDIRSCPQNNYMNLCKTRHSAENRGYPVFQIHEENIMYD